MGNINLDVPLYKGLWATDTYLNCCGTMVNHFAIEKINLNLLHWEKQVETTKNIMLSDLPQVLVSYVKLEFSHFLFLNSCAPLVPEDGNSRNCEA
jgi:hypothetical protein